MPPGVRVGRVIEGRHEVPPPAVLLIFPRRSSEPRESRVILFAHHAHLRSPQSLCAAAPQR